MKKYKIFLIVIFVITNLFSYEKMVGILHIHSNYSNENNSSIEQIAQDCIKYNIDVVGLNDHDILKVEYGLKPFHRIIKKTFEQSSVLSKDPVKYLDEIKKVSKKYSNLIIVPGVETTPAYYWTYQNKKFVLHNIHKHLLISGLLIPDDFYKLPVLGNELNAGKFDLFSLWPVVAIVFVLIFVKTKKIKIFLFFLLSIVLIINYPFKYLSFDGYKDYGEFPYQNMIDYVDKINKKNFSEILVIWAHPDAPNWTKEKLLKENKLFKIFTKTEKYSQSLLSTYNYDGFSIFAEGYKETGKIGNIWDKVLLEYCLGLREKPVWCFAEVDYSKNSNDLYVRKNILFVEKKDYVSVMNAYKKGRFYALWRNAEKELELHNFSFSNKTQNAKFGEEIIFDSELKIKGTIKFSDNSQQKIKIYIIRNGSVIKLIETTTPYNLDFTDLPEFGNKGKVYYRIFIESKYPHMIATNPVFVRTPNSYNVSR